jgi:hypothetical protein
MTCEVCDDTGMVDVETLPEQQPCLWCERGKEIWWSQAVVTTRIVNQQLTATKNPPRP